MVGQKKNRNSGRKGSPSWYSFQKRGYTDVRNLQRDLGSGDVDSNECRRCQPIALRGQPDTGTERESGTRSCEAFSENLDVYECPALHRHRPSSE